MHKELWKTILLLILVNALMFISCKKEMDNELPIVRISAPLANSTYQIGDKVKVKAHISDDQGINDIVLWLKDENHQAVLSRSIHVGQVSYDLEMEIWLDDASLNGRYYFDVTAYDDDDFAAGFRYINIGGKPKALNKVFILSETSNLTLLYELHGDSLLLLNQLNGDFLVSSMDVSEPTLYSVGNYTGDLNAIDTSGNILWTENSDRIPGVPHFNSYHVSEDLVMLGLEKGLISGFDHKGQRVIQKVLNNGFEAGYLYKHEDRIFYEEIQKNSGQVKLVDLYFPSGLFNKEIIFDHGEIVKMISIAWNKILFFINGAEGPVILEFDTEKHFFTQLYKDNAGAKFKYVTQLDDNTVSIVDEEQMFTYYIDQNMLLLFKKDYAPEMTRYDPNLKVLWCSLGKELKVFDVKFSNEIKRFNLDQTITSFDLYFSRD